MTDDQALSIYRACFPHSWACYTEFGPIDADESKAIVATVREVVGVETDEAGGKLIEWWDCWGPRNTATMAARKIRRRAAKILGESA